MMEKREMICIVCPVGCPLTVDLENERVVSVQGNTCKRGESYGISECTAPTRMLTTTVKLDGGRLPVLSVKTAAPIPKGLLFEAVGELNKLTLRSPVAIGDVVLADVCGTGVAVVATQNG